MGEMTTAEVALRAVERIDDLKRRIEQLEIETRALRSAAEEMVSAIDEWDDTEDQFGPEFNRITVDAYEGLREALGKDVQS